MDFDWPDCPVPGCTNKVCLALNSAKCFPHTPGSRHVKRWKIEARNGVEAPVRRERAKEGVGG